MKEESITTDVVYEGWGKRHSKHEERGDEGPVGVEGSIENEVRQRSYI